MSTKISSASTIVDSLWAMNTDVLSFTISFIELRMFWKHMKTNIIIILLGFKSVSCNPKENSPPGL